MKHVRRTAALGIMTAVAAGTVFATAAPAQAACAISHPNGVYSYYVCTDGTCRVYVLGEPVPCE